MPMPDGVNHVSYVIDGVVDGAVVKKQAEERFDRLGEVTVVHMHKQDEACPVQVEKRKCRVYKEHVHDEECNEDCDLMGSWYMWIGK